MTGYSRAKFPHWAGQYGECDTREVVLQRAARSHQREVIKRQQMALVCACKVANSSAPPV
ncbi:hypothetical protein [Streptomyces violascens]|uniref:hypothetical protein n=1 Tax=Streptomyces violascens TaxID=67381 RepID=UPI003652F241